MSFVFTGAWRDSFLREVCDVFHLTLEEKVTALLVDVELEGALEDVCNGVDDTTEVFFETLVATKYTAPNFTIKKKSWDLYPRTHFGKKVSNGQLGLKWKCARKASKNLVLYVLREVKEDVGDGLQFLSGCIH